MKAASADMTRLASVYTAPRLRRTGMLRRLGKITAYGWLAVIFVFVYAPLVVVIGASVDPGHSIQTRSYLQFPPTGFSLRWYREIDQATWLSLWLSIRLALLASVLAAVIGVPASLGLVRSRLPGRAVIASLFRAPLQIPFIVIGVAFLETYVAISATLGITLQGSFTGLLLGHLFVAVPYLIGAVTTSLERLNPRLEEAALILGASPWRTFRRITVPLMMPGLYAGLLNAFLISFTDVTISLFLAGSDVAPFPVRVLAAVQMDVDPTIPAISSIVFVGSIVLMFLAQRLLGVDALLRTSGNAR